MSKFIEYIGKQYFTDIIGLAQLSVFGTVIDTLLLIGIKYNLPGTQLILIATISAIILHIFSHYFIKSGFYKESQRIIWKENPLENVKKKIMLSEARLNIQDFKAKGFETSELEDNVKELEGLK